MRDIYGLEYIPDLPDTMFRPTDTAPIIVKADKLEVRLAVWGFPQPKDTKPKLSLFNARDDRLLTAPMWREAFRVRRCVVPASEFHEFSGVKGAKTRHAFTPSHAPVFHFAGLWEANHFTIITTSANSTVSSYHDRMPVILKPRDLEVWLDPTASLEVLIWLCKPYAQDRLRVRDSV